MSENRGLTKFTIAVDTVGAAFGQNPEHELVRVVDKVLTQIAANDFSPGHTKTILDSNGNRIGGWRWEDTSEEPF